jgi:hypothetical protein
MIALPALNPGRQLIIRRFGAESEQDPPTSLIDETKPASQHAHPPS